MQSKKFLKKINNLKFDKFVLKKLKAIDDTDPDRIYVENIRSFFNFSHGMAKLLCEAAVKENIFTKQVGLECPHDRNLLKTYGISDKLDSTLECPICRELERDQYMYSKEDLNQITFYKLSLLDASH